MGTAAKALVPGFKWPSSQVTHGALPQPARGAQQGEGDVGSGAFHERAAGPTAGTPGCGVPVPREATPPPVRRVSLHPLKDSWIVTFPAPTATSLSALPRTRSTI